MWGDLDSLGIVFYPRYYEWFDACGHLFFEKIGLPFGKILAERNIIFGLIETSSRYSSPCRYHQEIEIHTSIDELGARTMRLKHQLFLATGEQPLMVEAYETRICMDVSDPAHIKAMRFPADIFEKLTLASR
jgi:4-hydroxybenzoyl-CoA thioesterase